MLAVVDSAESTLEANIAVLLDLGIPSEPFPQERRFSSARQSKTTVSVIPEMGLMTHRSGLNIKHVESASYSASLGLRNGLQSAPNWLSSNGIAVTIETRMRYSENFMRKRQSGFSLIELLIVVAIILVITAIAVPNFLRSRLSANEASATQSMRTINTAAITYSSIYQNLGFPSNLAALGGATPCTATFANSCLLDAVLSSGTKAGYTFVYAGDGLTPALTYTLTATPVSLGMTGQRMFCSDQTSVIRYAPSGAGCTSASSPIQ
jgi:type IV pilus assembly protein PilA